MLENISDVLSIVVLMAIPLSLVLFWIYKKISYRKEKILNTAEKYYREW